MPQVFTCLEEKCESGLLVAPHGLDEILATFGDHSEYLRPDGTLDSKWQSDFLATATSPFPNASGVGPHEIHQSLHMP